MESSDVEGKLGQGAFQYWHQVDFRYLFHRGYNFPLRYLIHGIDMIYPFLIVDIPLMNCIYPNIARLPLWIWLSPLADFGYDGFRFGKSSGHDPVNITPSQIV